MIGRDDEPWTVEFGPAAVKALDRLSFKIGAAVVEFCTTVLPDNPGE
jgi:mRNA-degrading endonuclease RelE of RelBE toxin-antitoxin system